MGLSSITYNQCGIRREYLSKAVQILAFFAILGHIKMEMRHWVQEGGSTYKDTPKMECEKFPLGRREKHLQSTEKKATVNQGIKYFKYTSHSAAQQLNI